MRQAGRWRIAVGAALAAALACCPQPEARAAGFFDFLFGNATPPAQPAPAPSRERPRARPAPAAVRGQPVRRAAPAATAPKPDVVVAVFGDAFAVSAARGLNDTENTDGIRQVLDRSDDGVGLVATDPAAWEKAIEEARAQAGRIDVAVMMLGSNDGATLADPQGAKLPPGSPAWRQAYGDRLARVADLFGTRHVSLIWVGLPIVRDAAQAQLYAAINEVAQDRALHEGIAFVDSWQPFADENGDFSPTGPDVNGRPATLRWSNGWNFTRAGARKLASFLLPELKRLRDRARSSRELAAVPQQNTDVFDQALAIDVNAQILRDAGLPVPGPETPAKPGPVLTLTAVPTSEDGRLASIAASPPLQATAGQHAGRADDFAWPRR